MKLLRTGALIALAAASGCGGSTEPQATSSPSRPRDAAAASPLARRPELREVTPLLRRFPALRDTALAADDRRRLAVDLPLPLPFVPSHTVAAPMGRTAARFWLGPGIVGRRKRLGPCVYFSVAQEQGVGAGCFTLRTVDAGKAVQLLTDQEGVDLVGLITDEQVAGHVKVSVRLANGRSTSAQVSPPFYTARVQSAPSSILMSWGASTARVALDG